MIVIVIVIVKVIFIVIIITIIIVTMFFLLLYMCVCVKGMYIISVCYYLLFASNLRNLEGPKPLGKGNTATCRISLSSAAKAEGLRTT